MPTPEEIAAQEAEAAAQAAAAAAEAEETKPKGSSPIDDPAALRAELERTRKEAAKYRTQARDAAEAKRKAEEAVLAEQGKHKELAEKRQKDLEALQPELEQLRAEKAQRDAAEQAARAARDAQVAADFAQLPENVRAGLPADADARTKEIAVTTYRVVSGAKVPTTTPIAPKPASVSGGEKPTNDEFARAYHPATPPEEQARLRQKIADYQKSLR